MPDHTARPLQTKQACLEPFSHAPQMQQTGSWVTMLLHSLEDDPTAALLLGKHDVAAQHILHAAAHSAALVLQAGGAMPMQQRASNARRYACYHAALGPCAHACTVFAHML